MTIQTLNQEIEEKMEQNAKGIQEFLEKSQALVDQISPRVRELIFNKCGEDESNEDIYFRVVGDGRFLFNWTKENKVYLKDCEDNTFLSLDNDFEKSIKAWSIYPLNSEKSLERIEGKLKEQIEKVKSLFE